MLRFSLLVCVSLICGVTAKPYEQWNKPSGEAVQDTVLSVDEQGEMSWKVEVEPPEDMDETRYEIDPRMKLWEQVNAPDQQPMREQEEPAVHVARIADQDYDETLEEEKQEEPEADWDEEKYNRVLKELRPYLAPLYQQDNNQQWAVEEAAPVSDIIRMHLEPELDLDDLYHQDVMQPLRYRDDDSQTDAAAVDLPLPGKHSQPEEDFDHLYHQ